MSNSRRLITLGVLLSNTIPSHIIVPIHNYRELMDTIKPIKQEPFYLQNQRKRKKGGRCKY